MDTVEGSGDDDQDGVPNYLDRDSDNDGIFDIIEGGGRDSNDDGIADALTDSDGDGLVDAYDPDSGGSSQPVPDLDGDGRPDYLDRDSDSDGISDLIEGQRGVTFRPPSGTDTDGDGIDDAFEPAYGGYHETPPDTDGDGVSDYQDVDSDGDGESDSTEAFDFNGDGTPDIAPAGIDADSDGIDDAYASYSNPQALRNTWRLIPDAGSAQCSARTIANTLKRIGSARNTLVRRGELFAQRARACGSTRSGPALSQIYRLSSSLQDLLTSTYAGTLYRCPAGICTTVSVKALVRRLSATARTLGGAAKKIKKTTIVACKVPPHTTDGARRRKASDDYTNDLVKALQRLPKTVTRCP